MAQLLKIQGLVTLLSGLANQPHPQWCLGDGTTLVCYKNALRMPIFYVSKNRTSNQYYWSNNSKVKGPGEIITVTAVKVQ